MKLQLCIQTYSEQILKFGKWASMSIKGFLMMVRIKTEKKIHHAETGKWLLYRPSLYRLSDLKDKILLLHSHKLQIKTSRSGHEW